MKRIFHITSCIVLLTLAGWGQSASTNDENHIRWLYVQLTYLTQVKVVGEAAMDSHSGQAIDAAKVAQQLQDAAVQVTLSDFKSGPISDIANAKWTDFVNALRPPREVLSVQVAIQRFTDDSLPVTEWRTAWGRWVPARDIPEAGLRQIGELTVQQVMTMPENKSVFGNNVYLRYTTFTMTVTFQGKTSSGAAMFLFGKDPTGKDMASPQNPVLDFSGSLPTGGESFYPGGLMHSHLRDVPILSNWLAAQAMPASSCSTIKKQLCCSGSRCGISENDLQEELSTPLATPVISR